tara:strand:+ start:257 stop:634 length:378 start_codon:yes stop_codon:yes gene_type:complete
MPSTKIPDSEIKTEQIRDEVVIRIPDDGLGERERRQVVPIGFVEFIVAIDCDVCVPRGQNKGKKFNEEKQKWVKCTLCGGKGYDENLLPAYKIVDTFKQVRTMAKRLSEELKIRKYEGKEGYHVR